MSNCLIPQTLIYIKSEAVFLIDIKHIPDGVCRKFRLLWTRSVELLCVTLTVILVTGQVLSRQLQNWSLQWAP